MKSFRIRIFNNIAYVQAKDLHVKPHRECFTVEMLSAENINPEDDIVIELRNFNGICFDSKNNGFSGGSEFYSFKYDGYLRINYLKGKSDSTELGSYFYDVNDWYNFEFDIRVFVNQKEVSEITEEIRTEENVVWKVSVK